MRAVVQRVKSSSVRVDEKIVGSIKSGLLIFLGIASGDAEQDIDYLVDKIINLRIFPDQAGNMNLSALEQKQQLLVVPQFTLYGDCRQGRRPSFSEAAAPGKAKKLYQQFLQQIKKCGLQIEQGKFQASMEVNIINDGPVTMLLDSNKQF